MNETTSGRAEPRYRPTRRVPGATVAAIAGLLALAASASAADRAATPSTFAGVWSAAQAGDRIVLAAGDYGTFGGGTKSGVVTITPQPGATATMSAQFNGARNIRLDGLTIGGLALLGTTRDITVANSRFTGMASVRADQMANANIVFDGNTHAGINVCGNCYEGRLQVTGEGPGPSGVTVRNSRFGPGGDADGMQIGAIGVQVLNNEFLGIRQVSQIHSDALQLYGARNTVISGNYFHDSDVAIMAPDGGVSEQISDNVFVGGGEYRPAVQLGSHRGSQFVHNTVKDIDVHMDRKVENPGSPSRDGVVRDNVFVNGGLGGNSTSASFCSNCAFSFNLFSAAGQADGANSVIGTAVFAGGTKPATWAGFALAGGSPGKGNASDGADRGIRLSAQSGPPSAQPPAAPGGGGAAPAPGPNSPAGGAVAAGATLALRKRISWKRLRRGLRVRVRVGEPAKVALLLKRKRAPRALARKLRTIAAGTHTFVLRPKRLGRRPQRLTLRARVTTAAGATSTLRRTIRVKR